jgi:hypothetical protein
MGGHDPPTDYTTLCPEDRTLQFEVSEYRIGGTSSWLVLMPCRSISEIRLDV